MATLTYTSPVASANSSSAHLYFNISLADAATWFRNNGVTAYSKINSAYITVYVANDVKSNKALLQVNVSPPGDQDSAYSGYSNFINKSKAVGGNNKDISKFDSVSSDKNLAPLFNTQNNDTPYLASQYSGANITIHTYLVVLAKFNWRAYYTLTIDYTPPQNYTITYNANGGVCSESSASRVEGSQYGTLPTPTRTGYTFNYWADSSGARIYSTNIVSGNITLYANWTPYTYTIAFDGNGATGGSTASIAATYGNSITLPACGFTRTGYRFKGWYGVGGYKYPGDSVINLTETNGDTFTYTAEWEANIFYLRFNPNGATGEPTMSPYECSSDHVNIIIMSNPYTRDGYTFLHWNTQADGGGTSFSTDNLLAPNIFKPEHNSVIDLYAIWNPNQYTIEFDANGGIGSMSDLSMVYDVSKNLTANTFTKAGHTFSGWNTELNGNGIHYDNGVSVKNLTTNGTITLYAQWAINQYTIIWKNWDGSELEKKKWNYNTTPSYSGDTDSLSYETEDAFHDFDGWTPDIQKVTADATYTATYLTTTKTYTVIWKNADGQELERDDNVLHGSEPKYDGDIPTLQSDDPKYYYVFNSWDTELKPVTNNITYTATYTKNIYKYTVIWNDWDGTELEKDVDVIYDTPPSYDKENPVRESTPQTEYIFIGWKTEINETPIEEDDLSAVRGDITYTAVYEEKDRLYNFIVNISPSDECGIVTGYTDSEYKYGSELNLEAIPRNGYQFVSWYYVIDGIIQTPKDTKLEISIFTDTEITAIFEKKAGIPIYLNETQIDSVYINPNNLTITYIIPEIINSTTENTFDTINGWHFNISTTIPEIGFKVESLYINDILIN